MWNAVSILETRASLTWKQRQRKVSAQEGHTSTIYLLHKCLNLVNKVVLITSSEW